MFVAIKGFDFDGHKCILEAIQNGAKVIMAQEDEIDKNAGIILNKKTGDYVKENEVLAYLHTNKEDIIDYAKSKVLEIWKI